MYRFIFLCVTAVFFTACGGGSGGIVDDTPPTTPTTVSGKVIDGYIQGAKVCIDKNRDNECTPTDINMTSDASGSFAFDVNLMNSDDVIIAYDGNDSMTNVPFPHIVKNIASNRSSDGKIILSALTTLVTDYYLDLNGTLSLEVVEGRISNYLDGIGSTILDEDIANGSYTTAYQKNLKVFKIVEAINAAVPILNSSSNSALTFKSIATAIENNSSIRISDGTITVDRGGSRTVTIGNSAPIFTNVNSFIKYVGDSQYLVKLTAIDPDGDNITFTKAASSDGGLFTLSSDDNISFASAIIYDKTQGADNELLLTVVATDNYSGDNRSTEQNITIVKRATGLDMYNTRSGVTTGIGLNGINYTWDGTAGKNWYIAGSNILMPVGKLSSVNEGENFHKVYEGHYYVENNDYLWDDNKTQSHTAGLIYKNATGTSNSIAASNLKFQHDAFHSFFVSKISSDTNGLFNSQKYRTFTANPNTPAFVNNPTSNEVYGTNKNTSSYFINGGVDKIVGQVDSNNTKTSTTSVCATIFGKGWRIPTAYEMGFVTGTISAMTSGDTSGYIPAYVGNDSSERLILSSNRLGTYDAMVALNTSYDTDGPWSFVGFENTAQIRCIYQSN